MKTIITIAIFFASLLVFAQDSDIAAVEKLDQLKNSWENNMASYIKEYNNDAHFACGTPTKYAAIRKNMVESTYKYAKETSEILKTVKDNFPKKQYSNSAKKSLRVALQVAKIDSVYQGPDRSEAYSLTPPEIIANPFLLPEEKVATMLLSAGSRLLFGCVTFGIVFFISAGKDVVETVERTNKDNYKFIGKYDDDTSAIYKTADLKKLLDTL